MKKIVLLGSTGSIGESTLRVVESLSSRLEVIGLAVRQDYAKALEQAQQFNVQHVAVSDPEAAEACRQAAPAGVTVHGGPEGVEQLAALDGADLVLCAVVGMAGLKPVLAAVEKGTDVALATKEVLVAAGQIVTDTCTRTGARLLPVDSEHSALFQCLEGTETRQAVRKLILTASGGPFADKADLDLDSVPIEQALNHPRWNMGPKVTIDSATLMNKGLEIIEAHWLFNIPVEQIDVVIHPESIVHSMVEFVDGSILAQLSLPDMRFAIQYALTYPERVDGELPPLDMVEIGALHFREPDSSRFPCLRIASEAAAAGGTLPAVMNAANEVAVQKFLEGHTSFPGIWHTVEAVMAKHDCIERPGLADILQADAWARDAAANN